MTATGHSLEGVRAPADLLARLPLSRSGLDRDGLARAEPDLLERLLADPGTRVLEIDEGRVRTTTVSDGSDGEPGSVALVLRSPVPEDRSRLGFYAGRDATGTSYVGVVRGSPDVDLLAPSAPGQTLREVGTALDDRDAGLFTTILALANWHGAHGFCPRCGDRTVPASAGWVRRCVRDGSEHYPRTDPAVIVAVTDPDDRLLVARGPTWPVGNYSVLAGFVEPGEALEDAVVREVAEESGVRVGEVRFQGNQPWPFPCSLMIGFTARATDATLRPEQGDGEVVDAQWLSREGLDDALRSGRIRMAGRLSIARALIEQWYGGPIHPPVEQVNIRG